MRFINFEFGPPSIASVSYVSGHSTLWQVSRKTFQVFVECLCAWSVESLAKKKGLAHRFRIQDNKREADWVKMVEINSVNIQGWSCGVNRCLVRVLWVYCICGSTWFRPFALKCELDRSWATFEKFLQFFSSDLIGGSKTDRPETWDHRTRDTLSSLQGPKFDIDEAHFLSRAYCSMGSKTNSSQFYKQYSVF